jgi:phage tail-like protein
VIVGDLRAEADLLGGRLHAVWRTTLEGAESPADLPVFALRRKERDFEFTPVEAGHDDPHLVYRGTNAFLDGLGTRRSFTLAISPVDDAQEVLVESILGDDVRREVLRVTERRGVDANGRAFVERDVLEPARPAGVTAYYELQWDDAAGAQSRRATATPTGPGDGARVLYEMLPDIARRHDVVPSGVADTDGSWVGIPERGRLTPGVFDPFEHAGVAQRLVELIGVTLDHLRGRAEGLRDLRDVDHVDARYLPYLAAWVGWDLGYDHSVPLRRHEVRYAAKLYRITGTVPGCAVWVKRLTGWTSDPQEFWRNVFVTNDTGNPDDPRDNGSRTVDTDDAALVASLGGRDDLGAYTYDTSPEGRYAFDKIGFFVTPLAPDPATGEPGDDAAAVARKRARLLRNTDRFLPVNMRALVIVEGETDEHADDVALGVTQGTSEA